MNQYYSEELSQKTKRGLNESRLKGNFCGGVINYGYSLLPVYSDENSRKMPIAHKVVINEEEAPIVKEIFTEYANGKSVCKIVKELNERGIKNRGKPFITSTLYTMLKREKYTGIYRVGSNAFDKLYPPIVPIEVYEVVKKRLYENNVGKHIPDVSYILRGNVVYANGHTKSKFELKQPYQCKAKSREKIILAAFGVLFYNRFTVTF